MTNKIENILIALVSAFITMFITVGVIELTSIATLKAEIKKQDVRIEKQNNVIVELAKIEKFKIENKFDDVKAKDGQIIMSLDNTLSALSLDSLKKQEPPVKKTFWDKIKFWKWND